MAPHNQEERARALKMKRSSFKFEVLMFKQFLDKCDPTMHDIEIQNRLAELAAEYASFMKTQSELDTQDDQGESMKERIEIKNAYLTHTSHAQKLLKSVPSTLNSLQTHERGSNDTPAGIDPYDDNNLPKLNLPKFGGCYEDWPGFADQFKSSVHDSSKLNNCKKLMYLRSCLQGEAARLIQSLENSTANYQPAWELLESRYNKPAVIVSNHVRALFNLPQIHRLNHQNLRAFLNDLEAHYSALKTLQQPSADTLLIHLCLSRLDNETNLKWKEHTRNKPFPTLEELCKFLQDRCDDIEPSGPAINTRQTDSFSRQRNPPQSTLRYPPINNHNTMPHRVHAVTHASCPECKGSHAIFACPKFGDATVTQLAKIVANHHLCINCLRKCHSVATCKLSGCRVCKEKHNTLLHTDSPSEPKPSTSRVNLTCLNEQSNLNVILSTAVVNLLDAAGQPHRCRVLLDSCAQSHFLTHNFAKKLNLPIYKTQIPVTGMNKVRSEIKHSTRANIQSRTTNFKAELTFLLANQITEPLPDRNIDLPSLQLPKNVPLADPEFHRTKEIDGLIGAQLFWHLLSVGQIKLAQPTIMLRKTVLGWLIVGENPTREISKSIICNVTLGALSNQLAKFWELDEMPQEKIFSQEEIACERHYATHTRRDTNSGRYIVKLPFKESTTQLGESHNIAMKRFLYIEKSFRRDPSMRDHYVAFMREYTNLGHMSKIESPDTSNGYYLPHHAVHKEDSLTTKIRVVFDASAKTTSGVSLNSILMTGPTIQEDLFSILTRFRVHKYVLTADIAKMYRQIQISTEDRQFHKILWRENPTEPISTYRLNTVTYGTASASYLAIKSLHQLADDESKHYPIAAKILKSDFYVDDLLTGTDTFEDAILIRDQLTQLLQRGGFELRQWSSNDRRLIDSLTTSNESTVLNIVVDEFRKTLGLQWNQVYDTLGYTVKSLEPLRQVTKRAILSRVSQLFDPLGLLGPIIVKAKILMQQLWQLKINWDESIPETLHTEWRFFESQLHHISNLHIPRKIICDQHKHLEIHGFCDASQRAYGASLYIRSTNRSGCTVHLICSKSRVAPLKIQSIPRLELCAAVLLTKLFAAVKQSLKLKIQRCVFWSDSTIVLHWINTPSHTLKVFVGNRVSEIQQSIDNIQWRHVPSQDNPADCLSRGVDAGNFKRNDLWLTGPHWLLHTEDKWPSSPLLPVEIPELRTIVSLASLTNTAPDENFINKFSSLRRLERVIAYCMRFYHKIRRQHTSSGNPSATEIQAARQRIIKFIQTTEFRVDIEQLSNKKQFYNGKLRALNPFIDTHGILRVGGRITRAETAYDRKHPILLPAKHHFTSLVIRDAHYCNFHTGILGTLNIVRQTYWPINALQTVKNTLRTCISCYRANPKSTNYQMGNLPKDRVILTRPFLATGIDYCGPLYIKEKRLRNTKTVKAYVAVFICFATKAIHLELVGDLTTDSFLAALKRFFARRGKSSDLYTDNAKNFVGAKKELREIHNSLKDILKNPLIQHYTSSNNINWHFIPPRAPHFGGLWESAVKSVKRHLLRTIGKTLLTHEAMVTYLTEVEAIMNSRPLTPVSPDPNDLTALTPGHFLIGDLITNINESSVTDIAINKLSMWQHVQRMKEHFWTRWHREYLHELTVRRKWHTSTPSEVKEGTLVVVHEDNIPPFCWPLGRIIALHPGEDGVARVATIKTSAGEYKRTLKKLSPLPLQ